MLSGMRLLSTSLCLVLSAGVAAGCSGGDEETVTVLAAASLTDVFDDLTSVYEDEHPGTTVKLSYGGSPELVQQVVEGSPADVLATASPTTMDTVTKEGLTDGEPEVFATNSPVIVVPKDNPGKVSRLSDLAKDDLTIALCAPEVPCGAVAQESANRADLKLAPDTEENNVRSVLAKVAAGEADAGIVYVTDVTDEVKSIDIPDPAITEYPIAVLKKASPGAKDWVDLVTGDKGQRALKDAGFGAT
ncbi:molybdenum ABC transporter, periplasmic molybdate-binding protein [Stackebrandtia nassauensis DSM 44728]|uniref:Molybdenum ABC transporter, periplasmic molybdate-binding protein n=2 Tax=Stackebrandtia TaxID=283810 RepID=D3QA97_STANL|nr:molybdenum ABC transporter, periplasmic molybdate-binding protein [Stackebrandtia nassauensis DSM 44728]